MYPIGWWCAAVRRRSAVIPAVQMAKRWSLQGADLIEANVRFTGCRNRGSHAYQMFLLLLLLLLWSGVVGGLPVKVCRWEFSLGAFTAKRRNMCGYFGVSLPAKRGDPIVAKLPRCVSLRCIVRRRLPLKLYTITLSYTLVRLYLAAFESR